MKELKEEAKRQHEHKLHAYGGKCHAAGGRAEHSDVKEDEALIKKEVKSSALKHPAHKADGGPIMGGARPRALGRRRPGGGKGKTNVNVIMAGKPGGDAGPGAGPMPPLGGGMAPPPPRPAGPPMMPPPRPPIGAGPGPGPAGPMKRGGKVKKHHGHGEHHKGAHH